jgi:glutathione S-transferase
VHVCDIRRRDGSGAHDPSNPHPDGKVPALVHDGALITESGAVCLYLTDLLPEAGLGPRIGDPDRGAYLTWLAWSHGEMEPAFLAKFIGRTATDPNAQASHDAVIARILTALEPGPYLLGDRFSAADLLIGSAFTWGRQFAPESPALDAWLARIQDRPAYRRAAEKDERRSEILAA